MWTRDAVTDDSETGNWLSGTNIPQGLVSDFDRRYESGDIGKGSSFWMNILMFECAGGSVEQTNLDDGEYTDETRPTEGVHYRITQDAKIDDYVLFHDMKTITAKWYFMFYLFLLLLHRVYAGVMKSTNIK